jgi:hypothetical protein
LVSKKGTGTYSWEFAMHWGFFCDLIDQSAKLSVANTPISWLFGITMQARGLPDQNFPSHTACCTDFGDHNIFHDEG